MTAPSGDCTALQLWILDEAYDFPEPIWQLVQPTTWVFHDTAPGGSATMRQEPPERASVQAALTDLFGQGLLEMVYDDGAGPARPLPPTEWGPLLHDAATWQPRSPLCVHVTTAGARLVEAALTGEHRMIE